MRWEIERKVLGVLIKDVDKKDLHLVLEKIGRCGGVVSAKRTGFTTFNVIVDMTTIKDKERLLLTKKCVSSRLAQLTEDTAPRVSDIGHLKARVSNVRDIISSIREKLKDFHL